MSDIELRLPTSEYESQAEAFKHEFFENEETVINGSALYDQMSFKNWLIHTQNSAKPETVSKDWVVTDSFFAVRKSDGRIVGIIDVRHNIDHPFLAQYGGHIGYSVRPSERRKGYATYMLRLALEHAKSIGLIKVMLGCYQDNTASIKTIEKCGGDLAETKPYTDGKSMNIYWVDIV